tara:strand:+ start:6126 stop:6491 length:366 start_codon:yes stop_codon:yes gene_type:complete
MEYKQDTKDKAHELEMNKQTAENQRDMRMIEGVGNANVAVQTTAQQTIGSSSQWVVNLAGTVRPILTYIFFAEFFVLSMLTAFGVLEQGEFAEIWNEDMTNIFAIIISFWFGQKMVSKWTR